MRFSVYQVTRKGGREKNEDRMGYTYTRDSGLFALADGMGGHPEGEVASQLALQAMSALFQRRAKPTLADPAEFLQMAIHSGHQQLLRYSARRGLADSPRTTVVACVLQGDSAYWAHCGDSRLYLVRGGKLIARTRDHSYSELQQSLNSLMPTNGPFNRNLLFTCLGSPGKPIIDSSGPFVLQGADRLCGSRVAAQTMMAFRPHANTFRVFSSSRANCSAGDNPPTVGSLVWRLATMASHFSTRCWRSAKDA